MNQKMARLLKIEFKKRFLVDFPCFEKCPDDYFPKIFFSGSDQYKSRFNDRYGYVFLETSGREYNEFFISIYWNSDESYVRLSPTEQARVENIILKNKLFIPNEVKRGNIYLPFLYGMNNNILKVDISKDELEDLGSLNFAVELSVDNCLNSIRNYAIPMLSSKTP